MNEATRHEIVQRHQQGASIRVIANELGISRGAVGRVLAQVQDQRDGQAAPKPKRRPSMIDEYEPILKELLDRYPNLTGERALQELRARGFAGHYTTVRLRIKRLRPRAAAPVARFETGPGVQAQMDHGVYDIDFTREGRRRVYLFSYLLGYSRRQYLRFVESMDLPTTLREHVHAFRHLGGAARVCLYDNFKAVVLRHDADGPLYNPKFLAFATHYGFRPQACRVRRPQTKGKVERKFQLVEAQQLLALVAHYQRDDVRSALERAVRFGAFSLAAVRRIARRHGQTQAAAGRTRRPASRLARSHVARRRHRPTPHQRLSILALA